MRSYHRATTTAPDRRSMKMATILLAAQAIASAKIGMGGGIDGVDALALRSATTITLGDAADTYISGASDTGVTVGGQGNDTFALVGSNAATGNIRYAGGQAQIRLW